MSIIITVVAFGVMIALHEFGHFITAKSFGVLVHEFSIGMGPKLFSVNKGETQYSLRLLPIGGYVKLEGETETNDETDPRCFVNLHPLKRIVILFSGALMNFVLGFLIFFFLNLNLGIVPSKVAQIPEEYTETVFIQGDEITKLNNTSIHTFDDVSLFMSRYDKDTLDVVVKRNGKKIKFSDIKLHKVNNAYKLGVVFAQEKAGILKSGEYAIYNTIYISKAVMFSLADLMRGEVPVDSLSGPVEIVSVIGEVTKKSSNQVYLWILSLFAMISVNLGVFNLLPFPALDGGSIVFALYELITGKKVKNEIISYVTLVGFTLLMLLALFVTVGDIKDLIIK